MKVLLIHNWYQQPGGERVAVEAQAALLRARGHTLLTFHADNKEIAEYGVRERLALVPRTLYARETVVALRAALRQARPDVAHVHNVFPLLSPAVYDVLHDEGIPIVQTVHNFRFLCPNGLFFTDGAPCERCSGGNTLHALRHRCYQDSYLSSALYAATIGLHRWRGTFSRIDRFIALTGFAAHKLIESGLCTPAQVTVLGNFLPEPLPPPGEARQDAPYLLFLGRLSQEKGVAPLLDALSALPEVRLLVAGDGPERERLQAQARGLKLTNVEFVGFVEGAAKQALLRGALATVVPSLLYENFPLTLLESWAAATPVIAPCLGSFPWIVSDQEEGLLVPPGDREALRAAIRMVWQQPARARAMGARGRARVEADFTGDAQYRQLHTIYESVRARPMETIEQKIHES